MSRFTIDFDETSDAELTLLAKKNGCTKAAIIRRALYTYKSLIAFQTENTKISVTNMQDVIQKDIVLP